MASIAPDPDDTPDVQLPGHTPGKVWRVGPGRGDVRADSDELAQEIPIALEYNGIAHATLLASPLDLEDLAYGFSFTEGIIRSAADIYGIELERRDAGIVIQATIASACLNQLKLRRRNLAGRTGCGLCGLESLDEVQRPLAPTTGRSAPLAQHAIVAAIEQLRALQPLHQITGATHAAGWADEQGNVAAVREDVGRHNALDKLIGRLLRDHSDTARGFAVISSRASFEMVQKAAAAGINTVAAVSAPTHYAVQLADSLNVMLAGFARRDTFTVYAHPEYLRLQEDPT